MCMREGRATEEGRRKWERGKVGITSSSSLSHPRQDAQIPIVSKECLLARSANSLTNSMKSASERVEGGCGCRMGYQMFMKSRGRVASRGALN